MQQLKSRDKRERDFIPAAGKPWLLPIYDPLTRLFGVNRYRRKLVEFAKLQPHHHILDIGCGTGTFMLMGKQVHPAIKATGIDPDTAALDRAKKKARQKKLNLQFDMGYADELPYKSQSFDRVFSSLMFHHLTPEEKEMMLSEVRRVLKPNGQLHLLDMEDQRLGAPESKMAFNPLDENDKDGAHLMKILKGARLQNVKRVKQWKTWFGHVGYYMAENPG